MREERKREREHTCQMINALYHRPPTLATSQSLFPSSTFFLHFQTGVSRIGLRAYGRVMYVTVYVCQGGEWASEQASVRVSECGWQRGLTQAPFAILDANVAGFVCLIL